MTIEEAKKAIKDNSIIQFIGEFSRWGVLTCLSDDETTAYYKPLGMGFFRSSTTLDKIEIPKHCLFCGSSLDIEDNQVGQYCGPECAESGQYYYNERTNTKGI